jgi:hypothetical protein
MSSQEVEHDLTELLRMLEQKAVAGIAVEHGRRMGQTLGHRKRVLGVHHHVV